MATKKSGFGWGKDRVAGDHSRAEEKTVVSANRRWQTGATRERRWSKFQE